MTSEKFNKAQKLDGELRKWQTIANSVYNHGLIADKEHLFELCRILSVEEYAKIRDMLTEIATNKLTTVKKEFDEL